MADRQIKVLLIEDNPEDVCLVEEMLSEVSGTLFDVENADRLSVGLTRIQEGGIDVVLLDLGLPDSSGLDTFEKVYYQAPEVPIVMLTGLDDAELALEGMGKGAQDYLVKGSVGGDLLARTLRYAIERKTAEARIKHLNSVLKAIRNVTQLIVTETKRDSLLRKSCDVLVDARGYDAVWIGVLRDDETFDTVVGSGFREDIARFSDRVAGGDHPSCIRDALFRKEQVMVIDNTDVCGDCFFKDACLGRAAAVIRVEHADRLFGLLTVSLAPGVAVDDEEKELLMEVASDIGIALHNSEIAEARKVAGDALLESEKKYRILADSTVDCIWQTNLDFEFTYANPAVLQMFGFTQEEWVGSSLFEHCLPEAMKFCLSLVEEGRKRHFESSDITFEIQLFHKNGETIDVEISSTILFDDDGNPVGFQGATRNITERKAMENALLESEKRLQLIAENMPVMLAAFDDKGNIIVWNSECEKVTGFNPGEIINNPKAGKMLYPDEDYENYTHSVLIEHGSNFRNLEWDIACKDGGHRTILWSNISEKYPIPGWYSWAIGIDITERKVAEERLRVAGERFKTIVETAPSVLMISDMAGSTIYVSPNCEEFTGYDPDKLTGGIMQWVHEDDAKRAKEIFDRTFGRGVGCKDFEYKAVKKNGDVWYASSSWEPIIGEKGKFKGAISQTIDTTERKHAEDQIKRSLQEKEVLLREIHHRVKNNLQVVSSLLNMQARNVKDKETIELLSEARDRIQTMSLIHSQLYEGSDLAEINMKEFVDRLLGQLQSYQFGDTRITRVIRVDDYPFPISVAVPVGLVINELLSNALKHAFKGKGEGTIEVRLTVSGGGRINLTVSDDGVGLPLGFDINESKTLGLRLVKILTEDQLQGNLEVMSDCGTTFNMEFDITDD